MRSTSFLRLSGYIGLILAALLGQPATAAPVVIKLGTVAPEGSVWHDGLMRMRQQWRDASGGQIELRIYAGGVLGSEEELVRKLQRRAIDAVALTSGGLPVLEESFQCLNCRETSGPGKGCPSTSLCEGRVGEIASKIPRTSPPDNHSRSITTGSPYEPVTR